MTGPKDNSLAISLSAAVPLWIARFKAMTREQFSVAWTEGVPRALATIQEVGEALLYRVKDSNATARGFNALAEGIALLSFCPGGVRVFGKHWESEEPTE